MCREYPRIPCIPEICAIHICCTGLLLYPRAIPYGQTLLPSFSYGNRTVLAVHHGDLWFQAYRADVSDQKAIQELFGKIYKDVGPIGGVVCSAGTSYSSSSLRSTLRSTPHVVIGQKSNDERGWVEYSGVERLRC